MTITFNEAFEGATFADLFTNDDEGKNTWYRLWTGDADGEEGAYVDTSLFNDFDEPGWIKAKYLTALNADFAQADDTHLWIQTWNWDPPKGAWLEGWVLGAVYFSDIDSVKAVTKVTGDTPLSKMFLNANVGLETWYQIWIGDESEPGGGYYLDTPEEDGWIRPLEEGGSLSDLLFPAAELGESKEIWIRTWTPKEKFTAWEHWAVTTAALPEQWSDPSQAEDPGIEDPGIEDPGIDPDPIVPDDPDAGSFLDVSLADIITVSSPAPDTPVHLITDELFELFPELGDFTGINDIETKVLDDANLGEADTLTCYTGVYDEAEQIFTSTDAAEAEDILVVNGEVEDFIVLSGVTDIHEFVPEPDTGI